MLYKEEIVPYKRVSTGKRPIVTKEVKIITAELLVLYIAAFFIARVFMLKAMMPFGIAFLVAAYGVLNIEAALITGGVVVLGYFSTFKGALSVSHIVATVIIIVIMLIPLNKDKNRTLKMSVIAFAANLMTYLLYHVIFITGSLIMYDVILGTLESTLVVASVYIFTYGIPVYFDNKRRKFLSREEMVCLGFIFAIMVSGMWNVKYMGFSLRNMVIYFIILAAGYIEGPTLGAAWGIILGMVSALSEAPMAINVGCLGFCGLITGIFRNAGRITAALSFVVSFIIVAFYSFGVINTPVNMLDLILPVLAFLFIPERIYKKASSLFEETGREMDLQTTYIERVRDLMERKLNVLTGTLSGLSEILNKNIDSELKYKVEINGMIEKLADKVCANCDSRNACWKKEFYSSYDLFSELLRTIELKGKIDFDDIPRLLKNKCIRPNELMKQSNYIFELFRLNNKWRKRLINSKIIVAEQVKGISEVMKSMTEEIASSMDFRSDVEQEIAVALDRNYLQFEDVLTVKNGKGKYEVTVYKQPCQGKQECNKSYSNVISRTLGVKMERESSKCKINSDCSICQFKFVEAENYSVITALGRLSKEEVSGDNYSYGDIGDGRYLLALSDGMGNGIRAAVESDTTISLLEKFVEAGFGRNTALKAINSVLVLRSSDECFATVDMGLIDLHSGIGEFVKIGSAPTFIKSGMEVEVLRSSSIPAGILDEINIESQIIDFKSGDMIIMVTDGLIDANDEFKEKWVVKALKEFESGNPKDVAEFLVNKAKMLYGKEIGDDITVLVSKIWKII